MKLQKEWKHYCKNICPNCAGDAEVLTKSKKDNVFYDGEQARCVSCGIIGYVSVEDSECTDIEWPGFDGIPNEED